jgi:hypothetical protein
MLTDLHLGWIEIIGGTILVLGVITLARKRSIKRRQADRATLQAQLDMLAAAIDPEHRKRE